MNATLPPIAPAKALRRNSAISENVGQALLPDESRAAAFCEPGTLVPGACRPHDIADRADVVRVTTPRTNVRGSRSVRRASGSPNGAPIDRTARRTTSNVRRGISLLEVLFSVFVLGIGLLGLAALIPVGSADVAEATRADRGATTGRAANRTVRVQKMFYPDMWMNHVRADDPDVTLDASVPQTWQAIDHPGEMLDSPVDERHSVCIDPLFIARHSPTPPPADASLPLDWPGRAFPYFLDNDPLGANGWSTQAEYPDDQEPPPPPRMTRVSLRTWPSFFAPMMSFPLAERTFTWQDDLVFDLPGDATLRPEAVFGRTGRPSSAGDYSWMATLTPMEEGDLGAGQRRLYQYSVVVFYKRNLSMPGISPLDDTIWNVAGDFPAWDLSDRVGQAPTERVVFADFLTPGVSFGGGDVRLRLVVQNGAANDTSLPENSDFTRIRSGNWILLSGYLRNPYAPGHPMFDPEWHRSAFQWYRVLAVDDGPRLVDPADEATPSDRKEWVRDITLAGPDFDVAAYFDVDGAAPYPTVFATLVEGVVAVFTKTIELDTKSGW